MINKKHLIEKLNITRRLITFKNYYKRKHERKPLAQGRHWDYIPLMIGLDYFMHQDLQLFRRKTLSERNPTNWSSLGNRTI